MSDTNTVRMLAKQFCALSPDKLKVDGDALLDQISARYGRQMVLDVLDEVRQIAKFERAEAEAEYAREMQKFDEAAAIFAGLPKGTTFAAACRIKAAQGDPVAQRWIDYWNSREYRIGNALLTAAIERHPGWRITGKGRYSKSKDAPEEHGLVEWFMKNYPIEAREIERRFAA